MTTEQARKAVEAIIYDLSDRGGLSGEWDQIDPDVKGEIRETWVRLVLTATKPEGAT